MCERDLCVCVVLSTSGEECILGVWPRFARLRKAFATRRRDLRPSPISARSASSRPVATSSSTVENPSASNAAACAPSPMSSSHVRSLVLAVLTGNAVSAARRASRCATGITHRTVETLHLGTKQSSSRPRRANVAFARRGRLRAAGSLNPRPHCQIALQLHALLELFTIRPTSSLSRESLLIGIYYIPGTL